MRRHARLADFGLAKDQVGSLYGGFKSWEKWGCQASMDWFVGENLHRKPWFLPSNSEGFPVKMIPSSNSMSSIKHKLKCCEHGDCNHPKREKHWDSMKNWLVGSNICYFSIGE